MGPIIIAPIICVIILIVIVVYAANRNYANHLKIKQHVRAGDITDESLLLSEVKTFDPAKDEGVILKLRAKHFFDTKFQTDYCAIGKALKELTDVPITIGYSWVNFYNRSVRFRIYKKTESGTYALEYNDLDFAKDAAIAKDADPETIIRHIQLLKHP